MKQVPAAHNGHELGEEGFVRRAHLHDPPELPVCVALIEHCVGRGPVSHTHTHTHFRTLQYGIATLGTLIGTLKKYLLCIIIAKHVRVRQSALPGPGQSSQPAADSHS